jgi:hypothetical protein
MRAMFAVLCIASAACEGSQSARPSNGSISDALQRGMTEQQVTEVSGNRVPDRIIMTTCGTATPRPFPCKVFVYDGGLRTGQYNRKLSVVFEDIGGHWIVTQWL